MHATLPFLDRLALGLDADTRAIRRAYAREVKLIDQARDAARFQDLRDAYEMALQWAAYQVQQGDDEAVELPAVAAAPAVMGRPAVAGTEATPIALADPRSLATVAFDRFIAARAALTTDPLIDDLEAWSDALYQRLGSDDLINIEARAQFEGLIAQLLVQGWQPGHHMLLPAAVSAFQWDRDLRRLHQFGQLGAYLGQAIDDQHRFTTQRLKDHTIERDLLDRLRLRQVPDNTHIRRYMPVVERMLAHYPAFMAITVNPEPIAQWQARYLALPPRTEHAAPVPTAKPLNVIGEVIFTVVRVVIALIVLTHFVRRFF